MENITARFLIKELITHPVRYWKSWVVILILAIITHGSAWVIALKRGRDSAEVELSQQIEQICGVATLPEEVTQEVEKSCFKESFSGNETKWKTKFYSRGKDGFWCPTGGLDYLIWNEEGLKVNFKELTVEYEIKKDDRSTKENPPSFIFAYGEEKPIFRLWVPEGETLQLFRFSKNENFDSEEQILTPEEAKELSDPVKIGMTDSLVIEPTHAEGNDLYLKFTYNYTSNLTSKGEKDIIPKEVKLPISNIQSSTEKYLFGIGTYIGNCIRPVSYTICQ